MTIVVAPAGYGKSVLIGQWLSAWPGAVSRLELDERDADPFRLGTRLVAALAAFRPEVGVRASAVLRGARARLGDEFIDVLLEDLEEIEEDSVVVLDDFDRLEGPSVEDLGRLIGGAPSRVHFVIASRSDPALPSHRLRARDELVEPRADHLRFTGSESREVIERVSGHRLTTDEVARLVDVTEGWPVAVNSLLRSNRIYL